MQNRDNQGQRRLYQGMRIVDRAGQQATIMDMVENAASPQVVLHTDAGQQCVLPAADIVPQANGPALYQGRFGGDSASGALTDADAPATVQVMQEELQIGKRIVHTGKGIRVHKRITERTETVDVPLQHDDYTVRHVPIDEILQGAPPAVRTEGETLIVPVMEEVLVTEKRWHLKEELHITRTRRELHAPQTVRLKSEQVTVERFDEAAEPSDRRNESNDFARDQQSGFTPDKHRH